MARLRPDEIQHYSQLVRSTMGSSFPFTPEKEIGSAIQVERGTVFPMCLGGQSGAGASGRVGLLVEAALSRTIEQTTIVDCVGHSRPAYPGLLIYCWAQAYRLCPVEAKTAAEGWREPLRAWCGTLEARVSGFNWVIGGLPALRGGDATAAGWAALALFAAGSALADRRWAELASGWFGRLAAGQQSSGAFLRAGPGDNPETLWYHELVLLHAATSYAAQSNDALVTAAVMQAADYHLNETQPDHATNQPWGLAAFIWRREARSLADQMLHALSVQQPEYRAGVSSMLLADCLYCLRLLK